MPKRVTYDELPDPLALAGLSPSPKKLLGNDDNVDFRNLAFLEKKIIDNARIAFPLYYRKHDSLKKKTFTISLVRGFVAENREIDPDKGTFKWTAYVTWGEDPQPPLIRMFKGRRSESTTAALESLLVASAVALDAMVTMEKFPEVAGEAGKRTGVGKSS